MDIEDRFKKRPIQKPFAKRGEDNTGKTFAKKNDKKETELSQEQIDAKLAEEKAKADAQKLIEKNNQIRLEKHRAAQQKLFFYMGNLGEKYMQDDVGFYPELNVRLEQLDDGSIRAVFIIEFHVDQMEKNKIIDAGKE